MTQRTVLRSSHTFSLLVVMISTSAFCVTPWEEARDRCLLMKGTDHGMEKCGFTWYAQNNQGDSSIPKREGWYKLAKKGTTSYWEDKNGNGQKDEGEVREVSYWLYYRLEVKDVRIELEDFYRYNRLDNDDQSRFLEESQGRPNARRVTGLSGDEPILVIDQSCFILGDLIEFWTTTTIYLQAEVSMGWIGDRDWTREAKAEDRHWPNLSQLIDRAKALQTDSCGKISADTAGKMVKAWNQWMKVKIVEDSGPGLKGLYPPDLRSYWPQREEMPDDMIWQAYEDPGLVPQFRCSPFSYGLSLNIRLEAMNSGILQGPEQPILDAKKWFAEECQRDALEVFRMQGTDEAAQKLKDDAQSKMQLAFYLLFRRLNVICEVHGFLDNTVPRNAAGLVAYCRGLAHSILAKMWGGYVPGESPSRKGFFTLTQGGVKENGQIEIVAKAVDQGDTPLAGVPVSFQVDDSRLPTPGALIALGNLTDSKGVTQAIYLPPPASDGVVSASVTFKGEAIMGYPPQKVPANFETKIKLRKLSQ